MCVRWESRLDPSGRPYYVDHNTRTTTWQRPSTNLINNIQQYQAWRDGRQMDQLADRFLYPQASELDSSDPLGPLPPGWGKYSQNVLVLFLLAGVNILKTFWSSSSQIRLIFSLHFDPLLLGCSKYSHYSLILFLVGVNILTAVWPTSSLHG